MSISISEGSGTRASEEVDTTSTPRRMRSAVWEHYEKDLVDVGGELKSSLQVLPHEIGYQIRN